MSNKAENTFSSKIELHLDLPRKLEKSLSKKAKCRGLSLENYIKKVLIDESFCYFSAKP